MQHKCVKCGEVYEKGSEEILNGCICGSKLFYFVKNNKNSKTKKKIEESYDEINYFYELEDDDNKEMIIFDIEAINITSKGKYQLNLQSLMNQDGLIYKYGDGKYSIDLDNNLKQLKKRK